MSLNSLEPIRVVLVEPSHPGNIGAVARAMKTQGLSRLVLVRPKDYPSAEATARASGADDVLHRAEVVDRLDQAIADCVLVVGTSARPRVLGAPEVEPRESARRLLAAARNGAVALLMGRENSGLTNQELQRCHYHVRIPANPAYSSLNLASATQILSYEILLAARELESAQPEPGPDAPATGAEVERFFQHLEETLIHIRYLDPGNPRRLMQRLRRLFNRARMESPEVNILRGILTAVMRDR